MIIKQLIDEDFVNYKKPSMFIGFPTCSFKCCREGNFPIEVCQNCELMKSPDIDITPEKIVDRYMKNPITSALVCGGMEPFDDYDNLIELINAFRKYVNDDIVIYTGYTEPEIYQYLSPITQYANIIIKYGRYIPNQQPHYDKVLGIMLASSNQYAEKIS